MNWMNWRFAFLIIQKGTHVRFEVRKKKEFSKVKAEILGVSRTIPKCDYRQNTDIHNFLDMLDCYQYKRS